MGGFICFHQYDSILFSQFKQFFGFFAFQNHRSLAKNMKATFNGFSDKFAMAQMRSCNISGINIIGKFFPTRVYLNVPVRIG